MIEKMHRRSATHRPTPRRGAPRALPPQRFFVAGDTISVPKSEYHMFIVLMALAVIVSIACVLAVWLYAVPTADHAVDTARKALEIAGRA